MPVNPDTAIQASKMLAPDGWQDARVTAQTLAQGAKRTGFIPVRRSFVQILTGDSRSQPPMSQIVSRPGGGAVTIKLYLALIWKTSSGPPFSTQIRAAKWAELLGLVDPPKQGKRRISAALERLEEMHLISRTDVPGDTAVVELKDEAGKLLRSGQPREYVLPYDALQRSKGKHRNPNRNWYFKVPARLWTERAEIQQMSPAALAMLLAYLNEYRPEQPEVWWSTNAFPERYQISSSMRTRGTRELVNLGLLNIRKKSVGRPGVARSFTTERVRNAYVGTRRLLSYLADKN